MNTNLKKFNWSCVNIIFDCRLTERNCIEIVNRLIELKILDVVYTSDGKEYVTPQQVTREIQDELYVHRGTVF